MRAAVLREFGPPETLRVENIPDPAPGAGEVLLRVHAVSANYVDLLVIGGTYQFKPRLPFVPGKGPAGIVEAVGAGVTMPRVGDRILAMAEYGGYAEKSVAPARQCYVVPAHMSFVEAAAAGLAYDTAWMALRERGRYQPGETVLVLGASGAVGYAAVQLAAALGARVLAGVGNPGAADLLRAAGAHAIIDLANANLRDTLREEVYAATAGKGADIVLDPLGGDIFDAALRAVAWRGRVVVIGFAAGRIPTLKTNYLLVKNIEVSGLQISDYRRYMPEKLALCFAEVFDLFERGKLKPAPTQTFSLDQAGEALRCVKDREIRGRAVILP